MLNILNLVNCLEVKIFIKQIKGIMINFWSKYKQHELKKVVKNNKRWILYPCCFSRFKKLFNERKDKFTSADGDKI